MKNKKVIIIGSGIAGLSAGYYSVSHNFDTEIYEMHNISGGLCTSWKRKDYIIDGSLHWLTGSSEKSDFHHFWKELKAFENKDIINFEEFYRIEKNGKTVILYNNIDKLRSHLIEVSPEDTNEINKFINDIKKFAKMKFPLEKPYDMYNFIDILKIIISTAPYMSLTKKYGSVSIEEYCKRFKNPLIRDAFQDLIPKNYPATALLSTLVGFTTNDNGKYTKTSKEFSENIAKNFENKGGKIFYNSKIKEIIIENNKACGIILENGEKKYGDYIISACDGYYTIFNLLNKKYFDEKMERIFDKGTTYSCVQISLGVNCDLKQYPHRILISQTNPEKIFDETIDYVLFSIYNFNETFAPKGKTLIISLINTTKWDLWEKLKSNPKSYNEEKKKISDYVIKELEKRIPETKGKIEMVDVVTPTTFKRYTNAYQGSYMGWYTLPDKNSFIVLPSTFPNLENFQLIGQWTQAIGGLPVGAMTGSWAIQRICKKEKIKF